jgi:hypothetical protein
MKLFSRLLPIACLAPLALASPVQAQHQNIEYRSMAMQACDIEGWAGYGSYEACVEQTYSDMITQNMYTVVCIYACVPNFTPAYEMPCFGSRIQASYCQLGG